MKKNDCLVSTDQKTCEDMMRNMRNVCSLIVIVGLLLMGFISASYGAVLTKEDFNLYGYVDTSFTYNFNKPDSQRNANRIFDIDANSFRAHLAQLVFEKEAKSGGANADRAGFRIKLNFGQDANLTGGTFSGDFDYQEAYVQYIAPIGNGLDVRIGRMNTLIGYEVIESPLNPNFSRSWLFGFGEPFTTTGVRVSYEFNDMVALSVGLINAWNGATSDTNRSKSVEALLGLTPTDWVTVSLFGFWGKDNATGARNSRLVQGGGIITAQATAQTSLVLEGYYANQKKALAVGRRDAQWHGIAGYVIHDFDDQWGMRFRMEWFKDADGFLTGTDQKLWEGTATLQYKLTPSLITRLEFRYDKSNKNTFQDKGRIANNQQTLATEIIYLF
jgi:hypothetical protein